MKPGNHLALIDTFSERDQVAALLPTLSWAWTLPETQAQDTILGPFLKIYLWPSPPPLA